VYNVISTPNLSVNGYLILNSAPEKDGLDAQTVFAEIGIVAGNDSIYITKDARVRVNDERAGEVTRLSDGSVLTRDVKKDGSGIVLKTSEFILRFIPRSYEIDIKEIVMIRTGANDVHGIVGQTWNAAAWPSNAWEREIVDQYLLFDGPLDGEGISDYEVHDGLFGTQWAFNQFDSATFSASHPLPVSSLTRQE